MISALAYFLRRYLRLGEDDLVVLWLGRLSFLRRPIHRACSLLYRRQQNAVEDVFIL